MEEAKLEKYWDDIPVGKENAVTYEELMIVWGTKAREVRKIMHALSLFDNGDDYVLVRSGKVKGFYKTDEPGELWLYKRECLNKGRSIFAPVKKINRVLRVNDEQFSLENNLRVVRIGKNMKQGDVCKRMSRVCPEFDKPLLSKMENGYCLPTPLQLAMLAKLYGCNPGELIKQDIFT